VSLPPLPDWQTIHARLPVIFPPGTPNREHSIWEIAAKTIFVILYTGAIEGAGQWLRPDQVTRMTDEQAARTDDTSRLEWTKASTIASKGEAERWYAANTRESIRDDTIRNSLTQSGAVIEKSGLATTSPAGRYAVQTGFAALFDPELDEARFQEEAEVWRAKYLNTGALKRIAIIRGGAVASDGSILVTFPSGETRAMTHGPSTVIAKAVIETFASTFLEKPGVIFLSESKTKVVEKDDALAKRIGLHIQSDKNLPDIVLADLGPEHPLLVFVEVVATDGPVTEARKLALQKIAEDAGFPSEHTAFVTAYLDRSDQPFKRTVDSLAWGSYVWFVAEPDKLVTLSDKPKRIAG
jgi:hypothetical protein